MLLDILSRYLESVELMVNGLKHAYVEKYEEEILTDDRVNLKIRIRFTNGYLLELNEAVNAEKHTINHLSYRYHFQDDRNRLVFRYDNTPHFPDIESFPHHKHTKNMVLPGTRPSISDVMAEAMATMNIHNRQE